MQRENVKRIAVTMTFMAGGLAVWSGLAQAHGAVTRTPVASFGVEEPLRIKEKSGTVIVATITVEPGAHTLWHYHPGPHFVAVKQGAVEIYETDCSSTLYQQGSGFFDPGPTREPHVHTLRNPSSSQIAEIVITDIRNENDLRPTVIADPQPPPCFP